MVGAECASAETIMGVEGLAQKRVESLKQLLTNAIAEVAKEKGVLVPSNFTVSLERPRRADQGDWASNSALQLAKHFACSPRDLATWIVDKLPKGGLLERAEVANPGFINLFLSSHWTADLLKEVLTKGEDYGRVDVGRGRKVQVEFVSANPTGPLHLGHGRGGAVGDIMASILQYAGWQVEREFYINDAGLQMELLGRSTQARYFELLGKPGLVSLPEDGYHGEYIVDIAQKMIEEQGTRFLEVPPEESLDEFINFAGKTLLEEIKKDLADFGVLFDVWFSEKSLYEGDYVSQVMDFLKQRGYAYEKDGAIWFAATKFGDEKDRVLIRSNGMPTYFASDIVYHKNKYDRGFDLVINVWGADHHGYIPRMKAAVEALGRDPEDLQVILIQFVHLLRNGEPVSMSKRAGTFVTLREVLDEVGVDATRYFFIARRSDSTLDFDLELAKKASSDNPVFYVQYAHARICSIFREAASRGISIPDLSELDESLLSSPEEQKLLATIERFPEEIEKAAIEFQPHLMAYFAQDLAEAFHVFYNTSRVLGAEESLMKARLLLLEATRITLKNVLKIIGVSAPERMERV